MYQNGPFFNFLDRLLGRFLVFRGAIVVLEIGVGFFMERGYEEVDSGVLVLFERFVSISHLLGVLFGRLLQMSQTSCTYQLTGKVTFRLAIFRALSGTIVMLCSGGLTGAFPNVRDTLNNRIHVIN